MATVTKSKTKTSSNKRVGRFATAEEASQAKYGDLLKTIERLNIRVIHEEKSKDM